MFFAFFVLSLLFGSISAASNPDEIFNLPGLKHKINFRQFSGYLNASDEKYLHYWFVESQNDPIHDPVLLWMNGGPGCSSLDGFLSELGPFRVKNDGKTLYDNPFSWNKIANIIFLETPADVGYSYSNSQRYNTNDDIVSLDNYLALQHFFKKFPEFQNNDFFIAGENYAGVYVPTLSIRVLNSSSNINLKGFAMGNAYTDIKKITDAIFYFGYNHGFFDDDMWNSIIENCCDGCPNRKSCTLYNNRNTSCIHALLPALTQLRTSNLNIFNVYEDCVPSSSGNSRMQIDHRNLMHRFSIPYQASPLLPCIDESNVTNWVNQKSVREALHIPSYVPEWEACSMDVALRYQHLYETVEPQILKLLSSGKLRGLIYNGDTDMTYNFLGNEWFVEDLKLKNTTSYKPWSFNKQTAGFFKSYENLTFLTIKGSGQMVPQDKPGPALKMIWSFLFNEPY